MIKAHYQSRLYELAKSGDGWLLTVVNSIAPDEDETYEYESFDAALEGLKENLSADVDEWADVAF